MLKLKNSSKCKRSSNEDEASMLNSEKEGTDVTLSNNSESSQKQCSETNMFSDEFNSDVKDFIVFPDCWSEEQYNYFTIENAWLEVKNKSLGCQVCREISSGGMGSQRGTGIKFSKEWTDCKDSSNGDNKAKE